MPSPEPEMASIARSQPLSYEPGTLPHRLSTFLTITSDSIPSPLRSHTHHSPLNAYTISLVLEATLSPFPPIKRNPALRDLAQRLHLLPTDTIYQLQKDERLALKLLGGYINDAVGEEVRYMGSIKLRGEEIEGIDEMKEMRKQIGRELKILMSLLRGQMKNVEGGEVKEWEVNDLMPLIPVTPEIEWRGSDTSKDITHSERGEEDIARKLRGTVDTEWTQLDARKLAAYTAIEEFKSKSDTATKDFERLIEEGNLEELKSRVEQMAEIQNRYEIMGSRLYELLQEAGLSFEMQNDQDRTLGDENCCIE